MFYKLSVLIFTTFFMLSFASAQKKIDQSQLSPGQIKQARAMKKDELKLCAEEKTDCGSRGLTPEIAKEKIKEMEREDLASNPGNPTAVIPPESSTPPPAESGTPTVSLPNSPSSNTATAELPRSQGPEPKLDEFFYDNDGNAYVTRDLGAGEKAIQKIGPNGIITEASSIPPEATRSSLGQQGGDSAVSSKAPASPVAEPAANPESVAASAKDLSEAQPELAPALEKIESATAVKSDFTPPISEITTAAESITAATQAALQSAGSVTQTQCTAGTPYAKTAAGLQALQAKWQSFSALKKTCTKLAETSGFLCFEGTSFGAVAAKKLIDVAGPVLSIITSAQKACSTTASVTDVASKAMALAKGVCVAATTACAGGCLLATSNLTALQALAKTLHAETGTDYGTVANYCLGLAVGSSACLAENARKFNFVNEGIAKIEVILQKETPPTVGTASYNGAKCAANLAKDVVLFATNIAALMNAKKSADQCSKQLASGEGSKLSKAQYCESPANAETSFCKCQKDSSAIGCPGSNLTTASPKNKDEIGKDLRSNANGVSAFASGFQAVKPTAVNLKDLSGKPAEIAVAGDKINGAYATLQNNSLPTVSASGGSATIGEKKSEASSDAVVGGEATKKWSFGSFLGFGAGGSSSVSGAKTSNLGQEGLSKSQIATIQRHLASEKLRDEISSAAGKSNWEKVSAHYSRSAVSFITVP